MKKQGANPFLFLAFWAIFAFPLRGAAQDLVTESQKYGLKGSGTHFEKGSLLRNPALVYGYGQGEVSVFSNLYSQTMFTQGFTAIPGFRSSFLTEWVSVTHGVSKNRKLNIGLDLILRSTMVHSHTQASAFEVLNLSNTDSSRTALSKVGITARYRPFSSNPNMVIQSSFLFPAQNSLQEGLYLDFQGVETIHRILINKPIGQKWNLFYDLGVWYRQNLGGGKSLTFDLPASAFLSYFPTEATTVYGMVQVNPGIQKFGESVFYAQFNQIGVGGKALVYQRILAEVLATKFVGSFNSGLGYTFNLGLKYLY